MKKIFLLVSLSLLAACSSSSKKAEVGGLEKPNISMEISEGIAHPESVLYSPQHQAFFVSNVASGNPVEKKAVGYLSRISKDGQTINSKWVTGLHAPKGLAIVGDDLYVTDVTRVHRVSISKAKITKTFVVKDSKFLNDVVADEKGNVYVSDMFTSTLYRIQNNQLSSWIKDPKVENVNGLYIVDKNLLATKWGTNIDMNTFKASNPGHLATILLSQPTNITLSDKVQGHLDGITSDHTDTIWISDWMNGDVYSMDKSGKVSKRYNFGQGTADISFAKDLNLLIVPQMNKSKILFIQL